MVVLVRSSSSAVVDTMRFSYYPKQRHCGCSKPKHTKYHSVHFTRCKPIYWKSTNLSRDKLVQLNVDKSSDDCTSPKKIEWFYSELHSTNKRDFDENGSRCVLNLDGRTFGSYTRPDQIVSLRSGYGGKQTRRRCTPTSKGWWGGGGARSYLPKPCSWPATRAGHPGCELLPVARRPAGGANGDRGGRAGAAAATTVVLLRSAAVAAPWTCRPRGARLSSTAGGVRGDGGEANGHSGGRHQKRPPRERYDIILFVTR